MHTIYCCRCSSSCCRLAGVSELVITWACWRLFLLFPSVKDSRAPVVFLSHTLNSLAVLNLGQRSNNHIAVYFRIAHAAATTYMTSLFIWNKHINVFSWRVEFYKLTVSMMHQLPVSAVCGSRCNGLRKWKWLMCREIERQVNDLCERRTTRLWRSVGVTRGCMPICYVMLT